MGRRSEIKKPRAQRFCRVMAATGDPTYAAAKAGFAHHQSAGANMMLKPEVQAEIRAFETARLFEIALPAATDALIEMLTTLPASAPNKAKAIQITYAQVEKLAAEQGAGLNELPPEQVKRMLAFVKDQMRDAEDATIIEPEEGPGGGVFE